MAKKSDNEFSVQSFVRSAALLIAIVGSTASANAALVNLCGVFNTGATTTTFAANTQVLVPVNKNNQSPPAELHSTWAEGAQKPRRLLTMPTTILSMMLVEQAVL